MNLQTIAEDLQQLIKSQRELFLEGYLHPENHHTTEKKLNDPLTVYDTQINHNIVSYLTNKYPEITIISEEEDVIDRQSDRCFMIDPIDGTRNFTKGIALCHIGIALTHHMQSKISPTYNPITDDMYHAIEGQGSFHNNRKITIQHKPLEQCDVCIRDTTSPQNQKNLVNDIIDKVYQVKNNMGAHEETSGVACGKYDAFINQGSKVRDLCHYLLVVEAGGIVTNRKGDPFTLHEKTILATSKKNHQALLTHTKSK